MGYFQGVFGGGMTSDSAGPDTSTTRGTTITNPAVAHTKGSYVELTSATDRNAAGFLVTLEGNGGGEYLVDIAVGAAASEQIICTNLHGVINAVNVRSWEYFVPVPIPGGTRLAARMQSSSTTQVLYGSISLYHGGLMTPSCALIESLNADTANSQGTLIAQGGANNTKGAYTQIVASTTRRYRGLIISNGRRGTVATQLFINDVAIGAAASEQIIIPNIYWSQNTTTDQIERPVQGPFWVDIPAGTRIAVRGQQDVIGGGRDHRLSVFGIA
jgi:hypothetical protein